MKLTNKLNLPKAIFAAVANDPYSKGDSDFSVTELLKPSRQWALQKKYSDDVEEDVSDRLYALYGTITHLILERANIEDIAEKRFSVIIDGKKVSGQIDSLSIEDGVLSDYKFASAWGFKTTKPKDDYIYQLNMQNYIVVKNDITPPKKLQIIGLIRDYSPAQAEKELTYPKTPVVVQPIPMWELSKTEAFIRERISSHLGALKSLPECSREETWSGRRCSRYCSVNKWCDQYKKPLPKK